MRKAIEQSELALQNKDMPIGCVITKNGEIVAEAQNKAHTTNDKTLHAEILALQKAQEKLGTDLTGCTLYSNMEPCPMCSFMIRELKIAKVVFAITSKDMGGVSKYPILTDKTLSDKYPHHFGKPPEIVKNLLFRDAKDVFDKRKVS